MQKLNVRFNYNKKIIRNKYNVNKLKINNIIHSNEFINYDHIKELKKKYAKNQVKFNESLSDVFHFTLNIIKIIFVFIIRY